MRNERKTFCRNLIGNPSFFLNSSSSEKEEEEMLLLFASYRERSREVYWRRVNNGIWNRYQIEMAILLFLPFHQPKRIAKSSLQGFITSCDENFLFLMYSLIFTFTPVFKELRQYNLFTITNWLLMKLIYTMTQSIARSNPFVSFTTTQFTFNFIHEKNKAIVRENNWCKEKLRICKEKPRSQHRYL